MGQHDGTINLNEKERIAEPNDINGLILETSFTKMDMKSVFCFFFFIKYIGNFCKRSRPPILLNLLEVLPKSFYLFKVNKTQFISLIYEYFFYLKILLINFDMI